MFNAPENVFWARAATATSKVADAIMMLIVVPVFIRFLSVDAARPPLDAKERTGTGWGYSNTTAALVT